MAKFLVTLSRAAQLDLAGITDRRSYEAIRRKLLELQEEPQKRGKPMRDELKGFYSARAAGQRYRLLYEVQEVDGVVTVLVIGIRMQGSKNDIYSIAKKRLRRKGS